MKSIKKTVIGVAVVVAMGVTMSQAVWANVSEAETVLEANDISYAFGQTVEPAQVVTLSEQEMKETEGAVFNFVGGAALGWGGYALTNFYNNRPITWQGSLHSAAVGAVTGGMGGILGKAAGGGLGRWIWEGNMQVLDWGLGHYRTYRQW